MPPSQHPNGKQTVPVNPVMVVGNGNLACTIAADLLMAGYHVELYTDHPGESGNSIHTYCAEAKGSNGSSSVPGNALQVHQKIAGKCSARLAVVVTAEDLAVKKVTINLLEQVLGPDAVIAVNTESIALSKIQADAIAPSRIVGLNWAEPAHTTKFLEIITNSVTDQRTIELAGQLGASLGKDPYTVEDLGIRSRLLAAMIREAFYLVEKEYASVEDIDRACRNDAGYYLPFAGNCRYMDLMGTYAYGMVMKDLNADLSKEQQLPAFFEKIIREGGRGMENRKGIYQYTPEEVNLWKSVYNEFIYRIKEIINKYPFNYKKESRA